MSIKFTFNNNVLKIVFPVSPEVEDFGEVENLLLNYKKIDRLTLDLRNTNYIYSKNISDLISIKKITDSKGIYLILTDVHMGRRTKRVFEELRQYPQIGNEVPIIFVTGNLDQDVDDVPLSSLLMREYPNSKSHQKPLDYRALMSEFVELCPELAEYMESTTQDQSRTVH